MKRIVASKPQNVAQERQDAVFRKMSADKKLEVGAGLWRLARDLVGDKILFYGARGSKKSSRRGR